MEPFGRCRVCGGADLTFLFSLGEQHINDFVLAGHEKDSPKYPIELELCGTCSLVQMRHTAPQDLLYSRHYWYRSGVTETMRNALRDVVVSACNVVDLERGDVVLDIGSNDGTLLREYSSLLYTVGVEPAVNLAEEGSKEVNCFINDFWRFETYLQMVGQPAKIITALGMFYDLDDPNKFIADVAKALHPEGVFIAQLMCLRNMIDQRDVGNLCHEHLEFYSLKSLRRLLGNHGLRVFDIERNSVNGGSYRFYCCHKDASFARPFCEERMEAVELAEAGLDDPRMYKDWFRRVEDNRDRCVEFIRGEVAKGKRVWVYGASTKGNTILQWYGLDRSVIAAAAERSPEKWLKVTVGTGIPIVSEEAARLVHPDYFFVLPYAFIDEFVAREAKWHSTGGLFIVPLPEFAVL